MLLDVRWVNAALIDSLRSYYRRLIRSTCYPRSDVKRFSRGAMRWRLCRCVYKRKTEECKNSSPETCAFCVDQSIKMCVNAGKDLVCKELDTLLSSEINRSAVIRGSNGVIGLGISLIK